MQLSHDPYFVNRVDDYDIAHATPRCTLGLLIAILVFYDHFANKAISTLDGSLNNPILIRLVEFFLQLGEKHNITFTNAPLSDKPLRLFHQVGNIPNKPHPEPSFKNFGIACNNLPTIP